MRNKGLTAAFQVVLLAVLFASLPQPASAILYGGSWSPTANISDSSSDAVPSGGGAKDITGIWYAKDSLNSYFRMDVNGSISASDHANLYNIYITNSDPGAGIPSGGNVVAMVAFDYSGILFTGSSYTTGGGSVPILYEMSNVNKTLVWAIPLTNLDGFFYYMGATITGSTVNDTTSAAATPIPSAVWLLGGGIIGLVGLKRRQSKRR